MGPRLRGDDGSICCGLGPRHPEVRALASLEGWRRRTLSLQITIFEARREVRLAPGLRTSRAPMAKNPFIYMTTYPRSQNCAYAARVLLARGASW